MSRLIAVAVRDDAASAARCSKSGLTPSWWAGCVRFPTSASPSLSAGNSRADAARRFHHSAELNCGYPKLERD